MNDEKIAFNLMWCFVWLRANSGLNQTMFAQKIGCTQGTISKIESGEMIPSATLLINLFKQCYEDHQEGLGCLEELFYLS
jgi:DNA-binding XRE family transcriptional regulator